MIFLDKNRLVPVCLFFVILTLAVYGGVINFDYVNFDDNEYFTENRHVQAGLTGKSINWALTTTHTGPWIPLTWLSYMAGVQLYGTSPGWHHLTNVFFHIANVLLLFFILYRTTQGFWESCFVAALFAVHPIHVESVAWISERKDVLSTCFFLLTIWGYSRYVERPATATYLITVMLFMLGLATKPMAVTLPFVLLLMDYWPLKRFQTNQSVDKGFDAKRKNIGYLVFEKIPFFILSFPVCVITFVSHQNIASLGSWGEFPLKDRMANALVSYVKYIGKAIWPFKLSVFYPYKSITLWWMIPSFVLLATLSWYAVRKMHQQPYLIVGWLWYLGTLVPVIGLVKWGNLAMADRFAYVPFIGIYIILSWSISERLKQRSQGNVLFVVLATVTISILAILSWKQVRHWKNSVTLFEHAIKNTSNNYTMHNNLGVTLEIEGRTDEAVVHYQMALKIDPNYADAHNNLGFSLRKQGQIDSAVAHFSQAIKLKPDFEKAHHNLGLAMYDLGRTDEAIKHFLQAIRIKPDYAEAHHSLGVALFRKGNIIETINHLKEALRIKPDYVDAKNNLDKILTLQKENK